MSIQPLNIKSNTDFVNDYTIGNVKGYYANKYDYYLIKHHCNWKRGPQYVPDEDDFVC